MLDSGRAPGLQNQHHQGVWWGRQTRPVGRARRRAPPDPGRLSLEWHGVSTSLEDCLENHGRDKASKRHSTAPSTQEHHHGDAAIAGGTAFRLTEHTPRPPVACSPRPVSGGDTVPSLDLRNNPNASGWLSSSTLLPVLTLREQVLV